MDPVGVILLVVVGALLIHCVTSIVLTGRNRRRWLKCMPPPKWVTGEVVTKYKGEPLKLLCPSHGRIDGRLIGWRADDNLGGREFIWADMMDLYRKWVP